jgi:hypothetical protein
MLLLTLVILPRLISVQITETSAENYDCVSSIDIILSFDTGKGDHDLQGMCHSLVMALLGFAWID